MSAFAFSLVFIAALCHASWNLVAKGSGGGLVFAFLCVLAASVVWAPVIVYSVVIVPGNSPIGWSSLGWALVTLTAAIHSVYFVVLLHGYRVAPISVVYPISRGSGPLVSAFAAMLVFTEPLTASTLLGILLIVGGIFVLSAKSAGQDPAGIRRGVIWGGFTGLIIATYTIVDAYAVKIVGLSPVLYDYAANLLRLIILFPFVVGRVGEMRDTWTANTRAILAVAVLSPLAYILVLSAMKIAPVSHVAPARELSLMFGAFFGASIFKEGDRARRSFAAVLVALGVAVLSLS